MPLNLPVFYVRTASAVVFAAIMLTGLLWIPQAFFILIAVIQAICLFEYVRLMRAMSPDSYQPAWLLVLLEGIGLLTLWYLWYVYSNPVAAYYTMAPALLVLAVPVVVMLLATLGKAEYLKPAMVTGGGFFYITLPVVMLGWLKMEHPMLPLYTIILIWINDTMAYIVGSFIGKTPFSPISPKKTWEGTGGGALLTVVAAVVFGYFSHTLNMVHWAALGLIVAVMGTLGDLMESKLKRMAGVKDSGTIMPGHGGALDRFDSLLVATPFVFLYVLLFVR